ncbi:carotenoid oxygenase family protein [Marivirga sp. S37H4]|uniref:Carotenoid oxygenase family protein n=1 Tax=Marivirga aurantiaca TaxID=2802615 RepID=A0A934WXU7_9BACT|nr:carotenoid oxygenase family protein [Marivirga aurantiaca]MBK6264811.1 carotenoid oxygenase family protein [Marivirga aurantiaca]
MSHPNLLTSTREPLDVELKVKEGKIPDDLSGFVFINSGAGTVNSGGLPYERYLPDGKFNQEFGSPVINGDGYMFRFDLTEAGKVKLKTRLLKTPCFYADLGSSPILNGKDNPYADIAFKNKGLARMSMKLGTRNQINTAITPFQQPGNDEARLLATFDAGRPFEFDPDSMELITPIGENKFWRAGTPPFLQNPFPMILTTAHPVYDPETREVFSVNFTKTTKSLLKATEIFDRIFEDEESLEKRLEEKIDHWKNYESTENVVEEVNDFFYEAGAKPKKETFWEKLKAFYWRVIGHKFSNENAVYLIKWMGEKKPKAYKIVNEDGSAIEIAHNMHQIGFSKDYIILADTNFKFTLDVMMNNPFPNNEKIDSFLRDLLDGAQNDYSSLYIIPRKQLIDEKKEVMAHKVVLPLETVHFSVDYNNDDDIITIHTAHNCCACPAEWIRYYDKLKCSGELIDAQRVGMLAVGEMDIGKIGKVLIDVKNRDVLESESTFLHLTGDLDEKDPGPHTWGVGLYTYRDMLSPDKNVDKIEHVFWQAYGMSDQMLTDFMYNLYECSDRNRIYSAEEMLGFSKKGAPFILQTVETASMKVIDHYSFPNDTFMWSLQFVPSSNLNSGIVSSLNGYILCTVVGKEENSYNLSSYYSEIWLFDAKNLKRGPVVKLHHESLQFAFTIHSVWVEKALNVSIPSYKIDIRQDYNEQIKRVKGRRLRKKIQSLMDENVYPHFR